MTTPNGWTKAEADRLRAIHAHEASAGAAPMDVGVLTKDQLAAAIHAALEHGVRADQHLPLDPINCDGLAEDVLARLSEGSSDEG